MVELKVKHTAQNLQSEIENILKSFNISIKQIYSITTDNARNLLKCVELLSSQDEDDAEIITNEIVYDNVVSIKCAAHTLQLAVKDFLSVQTQSLIGKARALVKLLRSSSFRYTIENLGVRKPQLDVPTRWSSTFIMLKSILEVKEFCLDNETTNTQLKSEEWMQIECIVSVLNPVHIFTLRLQSSQLLLGDFYKAWLEMIFELKSKENEKSKTLMDFIESRQTNLMENDTMYSALFLDPRFRRVLSREKIARAKRHLKKIILQIQNVQQMAIIPTTSNSEPLLLDEESNQSCSSKLRIGLLGMEIHDSSSDDEDDCSDFV